MSDIKICPFRTYTEVRPAILQGQGDVTVMGFMDCLKNKCPAFYVRDGEEHCKRLAQPERKTGKWIDSHTTCSECGWQMIDDVTESPNIVAFNFCPNCGADMRQREDCDV